MQRVVSWFRQGLTSFAEQASSSQVSTVFPSISHLHAEFSRLNHVRGWASSPKSLPKDAKSAAPAQSLPPNASEGLTTAAPSFILKPYPLRKRSVVVPSLHSPNAHVPGTLRNKIDVERRANVAQYEVYRTALKALTRSEAVPPDVRFVLSMKLHSLPLNTSPLRVVNRCTLSKRPRGVYEFFRINRIALKLKMMRGQVPGMSRATWQSYGRQLHQKWRGLQFQ